MQELNRRYRVRKTIMNIRYMNFQFILEEKDEANTRRVAEDLRNEPDTGAVRTLLYIEPRPL